MKFPYHVYYNDVSYEPFEDVPMEEEKEKIEPETEPVNELLPFEPEPEENEETEPATKKLEYSKNEIMRMKVAQLRELGTSLGFENSDELTGADLKREIIRKLKL